MTKKTRSSVWLGVIAFAIATAYLIALLDVERQNLIIALLAAGIAVVIAGAWFGVLDSVSTSFADHEDALTLSRTPSHAPAITTAMPPASSAMIRFWRSTSSSAIR